MTNFVLIVCCLSAGIFMAYKRMVPENSYKSINAWLLYIALPALALRFVPEIEWSTQMLLPGLSPLFIWGGAVVFSAFIARRFKLSKTDKTALLITSGLGNTAFLGFPMIGAFYGEDQLYHAIVFDQVTFVIFSTLAVFVVLQAAGGQENAPSLLHVAKKIFRFPPFIASISAIILAPWVDFSPVNPFLDKLLATLSPLALFSIGLQLKIADWRKEMALVRAGLFYKLLLAPLIVLLFALLLGTTGNLARISVFEASMSSHITASLLASQYNMNPRFCALMVGFGLLANFITSSFWWWMGYQFF